MKKIPIGRDSFKEIIEEDFYYVDKTKMIEDLLASGAYVTLFPRPRRFGKSLMISTIDEFFNIEKKESNQNLFDKLYIGKSEYVAEQGKYPVISLNLQSVKADSWERMYENIKERIAIIFQSKRYIMDSLNEQDKDYFYKIIKKNANMSEYETSIEKLSKFLEQYYNQKVVLLIDEYDVPIQTGYNKGFYDDVTGFIKNLFRNTLKTNHSIKQAVMTGVLRVSKESIFSDLNNVKVYSLIESKYDEYFGFNETEAKEMLKYYGYELTEEVKKMYDGYIFGNQEIYNPWSILNYVEDGKLEPYWINTSADELLRKLFDEVKDKTSEILERLILGKTIEIVYNEKVTFLDLDAVKLEDSVNVIGNFLLLSGYLTIDDKTDLEYTGNIKVKIPNEEVRKVYTDIIRIWTVNDTSLQNNDLSQLCKNIVVENKERVEEILNKALQSMSFMDEHENFYHGYMLGLFVYFLNRRYIVKSNREAGEGRFDLMIESVDRKLGIIVEFKLAREEEDIVKKAEEGKKQIIDREYYKELELDQIENILTYSIAFKGKECKVI